MTKNSIDEMSSTTSLCQDSHLQKMSKEKDLQRKLKDDGTSFTKMEKRKRDKEVRDKKKKILRIEWS